MRIIYKIYITCIRYIPGREKMMYKMFVLHSAVSRPWLLEILHLVQLLYSLYCIRFVVTFEIKLFTDDWKMYCFKSVDNEISFVCRCNKIVGLSNCLTCTISTLIMISTQVSRHGALTDLNKVFTSGMGVGYGEINDYKNDFN